MPTTYPAPPFDPEDSGLMGPKPGCPVPCSNVIFSSSVISFTTSAARSSAERLVFIQGDEDLGGCDCPKGGNAILNMINNCRTQPPRPRSDRAMSIPLGMDFARNRYILTVPRHRSPTFRVRQPTAPRIYTHASIEIQEPL